MAIDDYKAEKSSLRSATRAVGRNHRNATKTYEKQVKEHLRYNEKIQRQINTRKKQLAASQKKLRKQISTILFRKSSVRRKRD